MVKSPTVICPNCGKNNRGEAAFCDACGTRLEVAEPPSSPAPLLPTAGDGRYIARSFLGQGGRKQVFRAVDTRLDREIALSVIRIAGLDDASIERVRREARQMARLGDHPNIVNIFDVGEEEDFIYLIAELMSGGSVDEQLNRAGGALPPERVLAVARQVAAALEYVHSQGIVHRDIKPANVWLSREGTAKLGDFGLAAGAQAARLTAEGMMLGTVAYMAPEQATGGNVDARSDLYSLGALLYEAATGKPPFAGDDAIAVISQQINTEPVAPPGTTRNCLPGWSSSSSTSSQSRRKTAPKAPGTSSPGWGTLRTRRLPRKKRSRSPKTPSTGWPAECSWGGRPKVSSFG